MSRNIRLHHVLNGISLVLTSVTLGWVLAMMVRLLHPSVEQAVTHSWQLNSLIFSMVAVSLIPFLLTLPHWVNWTQPANNSLEAAT
jgi:hypothetical protein